MKKTSWSWTLVSGKVLLAILYLIPYTLVIVLLTYLGAGRELLRSEQPSEIQYHSYGPYVLVVREGSAKLGLFSGERYRVVAVTKSIDESYGHFVEVDLRYDVERAEWEEGGVRVIFEGGHELFVPKKAFIGGR